VADVYFDNDAAARPLANLLHGYGHTVRTARELGRHDDEDEEQLLFAAQNRLILVTRNARDFALRQGAWLLWAFAWRVQPCPDHAGILMIRQQPHRPYLEVAQAIHGLVTSLPPLGLTNALYLWDTATRTWLMGWRP